MLRGSCGGFSAGWGGLLCDGVVASPGWPGVFEANEVSDDLVRIDVNRGANFLFLHTLRLKRLCFSGRIRARIDTVSRSESRVRPRLNRKSPQTLRSAPPVDRAASCPL